MNFIEVTRNGQPNVKGGGINNEGNSGGPLFIDNNAVGITSAGTADYSWYSPISNLSTIGALVLTQ